jgi:hypothetical protein
MKFTYKILLVAFTGLFFNVRSAAQFYKLNFGLSSPQPVSTLPHTETTIPQPVRKAKVVTDAKLEVAPDGSFNIVKGWELIEANKAGSGAEVISVLNYNSAKWYNATVPGTVLTTLVQQGVYPDPYFGLNNVSIPDSLCRENWWYRTVFSIPAAKKGKVVWLQFNGINYKAAVWLNGKKVGEINGAFCRGNFDISRFVNPAGKNVLAVFIQPPPHPGIPHEESPKAGTGPNGGLLCLDGPTFISSEGWDWIPGIRDRNIGIWQDVQLKFTDAVTIDNPHIITDLPLPDTNAAKITISAEVFNASGISQEVTVHSKIEQINCKQKVVLEPHSKKVVVFSADQYPQLHMQHPRLWWPNGYGNPALYNAVITVAIQEKISDQKTVRFGVRELSYDLTVDMNAAQRAKRIEFNPIDNLKGGKPLFNTINRRDVLRDVWIPQLNAGIDPRIFKISDDSLTAPYLVIKVNGQPIFCKGGSWGMDDGMKNVSRDHLEPYMRLHRDAHFNMVRNWTGESTEEVFYDLCDEYGMLVWNDFWMSTEGYNLYPEDNQLFLDNAVETIRRFRNHPSIAIWCPRNEGGAQEIIEKGLITAIATEDGTRYYQSNSRYVNLRPSGPWNYFRDPADYFRNNANGFDTELGTPCIPTAGSMRRMMSAKDVWPISDAWYYHDLHDGQLAYRAAIDSLYGTPAGLEDFCSKAQMINYDSHRAMFESWNSKLWNNTSGLLLWMTHPAWPSTVWQVYSSDYETPASYFACMHACEPTHIQMNLHNNTVVVVNATLHRYPHSKAVLTIYDLHGNVLQHKEEFVDVETNKNTNAFVGQLATIKQDIYLARVELVAANGTVISINDYWKNGKEGKDFKELNELSAGGVQIDYLTGNNTNSKTVLVKNTASVIAAGIKLNLVNSETKEIILPAYFSDGYFNLLPGESKTIQVEFPETDAKKQVNVVAETYHSTNH